MLAKAQLNLSACVTIPRLFPVEEERDGLRAGMLPQAWAALPSQA